MGDPVPVNESASRAERGHGHTHGEEDGHDHDGHGHAHAHAGGSGQRHAHSAEAAQGAFTAREARQARRLVLVLVLVGAFFVLELGGALLAESVVLQADALHLLMDVLALAVSLVAMRLAVRRPTPRFTYGLRRAEPVAAIFSAFLVLATTIGIVFEGIQALHERTPPKAGIMLVIAVMALVVNGASAWILHDAIGHAHPHKHDPDNPDDHEEGGENERNESGHGHGGHALNLRGAWLHLLGDTLGALAALCAALVIRFGGPPAADPIASFVVAAILFFGSLRLLRDATHVLFEAAPPHLPVEAIHQVVAAFPGVVGVHDLHVWTLGAGHDAVTVHVKTASHDASLGQRLSQRIREALHVEYVTVQVEVGDDSCG
jgi:cation diffusion facilitator family transporter